ncbi:MAG: chromosomal replication initiator protein DnaA [Chloroflexota bacterium]|nr:chromosomal replication initiator protein DnaA [Chloroflexota bacterium]
MNAKQIWQTALERLQTRVQPAIFTTWFQGTYAHSFQGGIFVVHVPTTFAKAHLEGRFADVTHSILMEITSSPVEIQFVVAKELAPQSDEMPGMYTPTGKKPYHLPKNRPVKLKPDKYSSIISGLEDTVISPIVMNSVAPTPTRPNAHRSADSFEPDPEKFQSYTETPGQGQRRPEPVSPPRNGEGLLIPRYTFDTFIVGKSNQLAHAASMAVAENPGRIYNPLFFYGGVGLGKTHLLHAVGHMGELAGLNVLYVTSEKFTNEIINAIRSQKTAEFRMKYRQIDILLVDDIQFIAGKEATEEEFFHTFNTLYDANKQIVVTSDRPPKAIHSLQDRLRSRFEWGLLADVQSPEYEHRLAILRSKAELMRFVIPASVIEYIARPECSNVRELEGSLNRVIAYATLNDAPLSVSLAARALEHLYTSSKQTSVLTIEEIIEGVCRYYNVDAERLRGKQRNREIAWPRQVAMYVMREETGASLLQIGGTLGGRDHTTIIHGWEKVQAEMKNNDQTRREIARLLEMLRQR